MSFLRMITFGNIKLFLINLSCSHGHVFLKSLPLRLKLSRLYTAIFMGTCYVGSYSLSWNFKYSPNGQDRYFYAYAYPKGMAYSWRKPNKAPFSFIDTGHQYAGPNYERKCLERERKRRVRAIAAGGK